MSDTPSPEDRTTGQLIILNGASSSGKTSIAKALKEKFQQSGQNFTRIEADDYLGDLPPPDNAEMRAVIAEDKLRCTEIWTYTPPSL